MLVFEQELAEIVDFELMVSHYTLVAVDFVVEA